MIVLTDRHGNEITIASRHVTAIRSSRYINKDIESIEVTQIYTTNNSFIVMEDIDEVTHRLKRSLNML